MAGHWNGLVYLAMCAVALAEPLLLTPLIDSGQISEARARSAVHYDGKELGYSGFISVQHELFSNVSNNIYFWYQPCTNQCDPTVTETVVWLQGGPGAPGTHGAMGEIGNWFVDPVDGKLKERCFSWCATRNCIFVDQPIQTGWSFQTTNGKFDPTSIVYTSTSADAMYQVVQLLNQFRTIFPAAKQAPWVIAGESYGGIYCANLGAQMRKHNRAYPDDVFNLTAILVGDPALNPIYQWPTHAPMLHGMGLVMRQEKEELDLTFSRAIQHALQGNCSAAFAEWDSVWNDAGGGGAPGRYFELTGSSFPQSTLLAEPPSEWKPYKTWLSSSNVMAALHADGIPGSSGEEGGLVYSTMVNSGDFCSNSSEIYAELFLSGIDLLIFSSNVDALLGPANTEAGVEAMFDYAATLSSDGTVARQQFMKARQQVWKVDSKSDDNVAGFAKCIDAQEGIGRFCFGIVKNAGHEMPSYQPRAALDLYQRFVSGRNFDSTGDRPETLPSCAPCGGVKPFAGPSVKACQA